MAEAKVTQQAAGRKRGQLPDLHKRFLASGETFQSLHYQFRLGKSTISDLVSETCQVMWNKLQLLHLPNPTQSTWLESAQGFLQNANFPNFVGALDGKHVRIRKPSGSGSLCYNYKKYFSIILMAIADINYKFLAVDIGAYGQNNDSRVFRESNFGQALYTGSFQFPPPQPLPGTEGPPIPFVLVADEAFLMCKNLLKPFSGRRLTPERRIFNYRLTRARKFIECSFGILTSKWRVLTTAIMVNPEKVDKIIKACVVLHNFVISLDSSSINIEEVQQTPLLGFQSNNLRSPVSVLQIRDHFQDYFLSSLGSLPWQEDH
ncbi:uncharacterized protein LOC130272627 isoform X2 [Hyla sarda]|uniref:uncharacterized protein LOC130272627 isoform X2 n=1 Tax=Hyla sarda TaxID=327740 RepID=UPI0024C21643|nr:uncharacterized protein LOC130272627 isoform X2 [Hyla sarda]